MALSNTTLAVLRGRVRERLLETFWKDPELNLYINEALRVWNVLTQYNQARVTVGLVGNTDGLAVTDIASDCLAPLRFIDTTRKIPLNDVPLEELSHIEPDWLNDDTGTVDSWIPIGLDHFHVHPLTLSNLISVDYIQLAPLPASDTDFIQVAEDDIPAIIDYVTFIGRLKEGGAEFKAAIPLFQNFLRQAARYNSKLLRMSIYRNLLGLPGQQDTRPAQLTR